MQDDRQKRAERRIEDYAMIGDCHTAALISRHGSIDWACFPRFDSAACFAALIGDSRNGFWRIAPAGGVARMRRAYEPGTLILSTDLELEGGAVRIIDFMPAEPEHPSIIRIVEGRRGRVAMDMDLAIRFDYGQAIPWVTRREGGIDAICGPDKLRVIAPVKMVGHDMVTSSRFSVAEGERLPFVMTWFRSHHPEPPAVDAAADLVRTRAYWREWSGVGATTPALAALPPDWRDAVLRSLITLKAMTYAPTGGIVAAVTTSLPEVLGGERNWDYRYCWLRDASWSLEALESAGYTEEVAAWYRWLLRAAFGDPAALQILYGLAGERRILETELPWLPGFAGSRPVRTGNAAHAQFQLDVYGEVLDALFVAAERGVKEGREGWDLQRALVARAAQIWREPDCGIWEVRSEPRHFTHSKVMAWVAVDRTIRMAERFGLDGPKDAWRTLRQTIHDDVCAKAYDPELGTFVQAYGNKILDASLLRLPLVGFLPATDPRMRRTIERIARDLVRDGLVRRYLSAETDDGLAGEEGAFLLCTFWLVMCLKEIGRDGDAKRLFERLLALRNDVGLLAEEYDPRAGRQLGNFPQAFSHLGLVKAALTLGGQP